MENNEENRKKIAMLIVLNMDPDRMKTLLAMQYMEDLKDEETFQSVVKTIEDATKRKQEREAEEKK